MKLSPPVNEVSAFIRYHCPSAFPVVTHIARIVAAASLLIAWFAAPLAQTVLAAGDIVVNSTNDFHCPGFANQSAPGCSSANDSHGNISIRSALEYASSSGGATIIHLPTGTYNLSLGDLVAGTQAGANIYINGQGNPSTTTIHQTITHRTLFVINTNASANVVFKLDNVTVSGGNEYADDPDGFSGNGGAILAGGSSSATGNTVTLNNVVFSGNKTNGNASGGAIAMTGGGDLTITGSVFSNNQAGVNGSGSGGAIYFDNGGNPGNVSINSTTFTDNLTTGSSGGGQGGAVYLAGGSGSTYTLINNRFFGNIAVLQGGAIYLSRGSLTGTFNRLTGNTAATGSGIYVGNNAGANADMRNNWWGCNLGPGNTGCDTTFPASSSPAPPSDGQITFDTHLVSVFLPIVDH